ESRGQEYIIGMGYRVKDLRFRTRIGGKRTTLKGDLNIKADLSNSRDVWNETCNCNVVLHKLRFFKTSKCC
ncbi:hypothetical protein N9W60_05675, partial [Flavobacteriaceae bacterium]|nr:hypothetical protein [Flavobacteriaceae bacterium]